MLNKPVSVVSTLFEVFKAAFLEGKWKYLKENVFYQKQIVLFVIFCLTIVR